jgi:hypothetical protein
MAVEGKCFFQMSHFVQCMCRGVVATLGGLYLTALLDSPFKSFYELPKIISTYELIALSREHTG